MKCENPSGCTRIATIILSGQVWTGEGDPQTGPRKTVQLKFCSVCALPVLKGTEKRFSIGTKKKA